MRTLLKWSHDVPDQMTAGDRRHVFERLELTDRECDERCYATGKEYAVLKGCGYDLSCHCESALRIPAAGHCRRGDLRLQKCKDGEGYKIEAWTDGGGYCKTYPGHDLIGAALKYEQFLDKQRPRLNEKWPGLAMRVNLGRLGYKVRRPFVSAWRRLSKDYVLVALDERTPFGNRIILTVARSLKDIAVRMDNWKYWCFYAAAADPDLYRCLKNPYNDAMAVLAVVDFERLIDRKAAVLNMSKEDLDKGRSRSLLKKMEEA
ncbi:MAG: hypothetical protein J6Y62_06885 [Clostridia bacterium]|nr:hypothetical protein [Clostridia bacterium]